MEFLNGLRDKFGAQQRPNTSNDSNQNYRQSQQDGRANSHRAPVYPLKEPQHRAPVYGPKPGYDKEPYCPPKEPYCPPRKEPYCPPRKEPYCPPYKEPYYGKEPYCPPKQPCCPPIEPCCPPKRRCEVWCNYTTWVGAIVAFFVTIIAAMAIVGYVTNSQVGQTNMAIYDALMEKPAWLPNSSAFLSLYLTGAIFLSLAVAGIIWYHDCFVLQGCCEAWEGLIATAAAFTLLYLIFPVVAFVAASWYLALGVGIVALILGFMAVWLFRSYEFFWVALVIPVILLAILTAGSLFLIGEYNNPNINLAFN